MKRKVSIIPSALVHEIERLKRATGAELKERWRSLYGTERPRRISRDLLVRALAYRLQEQALGGLKPSTRRLLAKVAAHASADRPIEVAPEPNLKPGTVLLREWHGTQHQVVVREDGIVFRGKPYKSLSEVAYRITGTKWSGPRFFGLKANRHQEPGDGPV
ncbi:MAG: DUF2924 domain-containing protein [Terriglobales bacterium]